MTATLRDIEIRSAAPVDAPALARLSAEFGYPAAADGLRERLADLLSDGHHEVLVAFLPDGTVVGWIHVFVAVRVESDRFAELGGLVVSRKHRRRGIGRRLMAAAEAWAVDHGGRRLRVRGRLERADAKAFYERTGFSETKVQRVLDKPLDERG